MPQNPHGLLQRPIGRHPNRVMRRPVRPPYVSAGRSHAQQPIGGEMTQVTQEQLEDIEALFVQTAASTTSDGARITLLGMSPSTLYFADRPQREVGHMSTRQFVGLWGEGENSFERSE